LIESARSESARALAAVAAGFVRPCAALSLAELESLHASDSEAHTAKKNPFKMIVFGIINRRVRRGRQEKQK